MFLKIFSALIISSADSHSIVSLFTILGGFYAQVVAADLLTKQAERSKRFAPSPQAEKAIPHTIRVALGRLGTPLTRSEGQIKQPTVRNAG